MKMGVRKPSVKKSIKARTTGKVKRSIKKTVNPLYGKKGMGFVNDPERAVKNAVYNRTTVGVGDILDHASAPADLPQAEAPVYGNGIFVFLIVLCSVLVVLSLLLTIAMPVVGIAGVVLGILGIVYSVKHIKNNKQ